MNSRELEEFKHKYAHTHESERSALAASAFAHRKACPSHCCADHGCKYGYDDCPVALGFIKQEYPCEMCNDDAMIFLGDKDMASRVATLEAVLRKIMLESNDPFSVMQAMNALQNN